MHLKSKLINCWQLKKAYTLICPNSHNWSDLQLVLVSNTSNSFILNDTDTELIKKNLCFGGQGGQICPLAPLGQSINLWPAGAGAGADPLHSPTEQRPAPNAWFTLPLLLLQWWCSHYRVMWEVICHFCLTELENFLSLVHLQLLQRGVDALQMRGISFPCSLLHGNLIRFCMTDHRKQQKVEIFPAGARQKKHQNQDFKRTKRAVMTERL